MRTKYFALFLIFFMSLSLAYASDFSVGTPLNSIADNYAKNSYLGGWVNISFNNISSYSIFTDSLNNQIYLADILNSPQNSEYVFSCDTQSCLSNYNVVNPEMQKTFSLDSNSTKLIGIGFEENIDDINSISFDISSNAPKSCANQIAVDIFNDGVIDYINSQGSGSMCTEVYKGCSEIPGGPSGNGGTSGNNTVEKNNTLPSELTGLKAILSLFKISKTGKSITGNIIQTSNVVISEIPLCQRIEFPIGPEYEVGAWIKEEISGTKQFKIDVYTLDGTKIDSCQLSKANLPQGGSAYLGCNTNFYLISSQELYVCLSATSGTGNFVTQGYVPTGGKCAFQGIPPKTEVAAYDIYIRKQEFGSLSNGLSISNNISNGITLANLIKEYIITNYGNLNCSGGCAAPIKIYSQTSQTITINNISILYQGTLGQTESKKVYDIEENLARISSHAQKLYLNGFFQLPSSAGTLNYNLKLNGNSVFTKSIAIKDLTININPLTVSASIPTSFNFQISPSQSIKKSIWFFGDSRDSFETNNNSISHTYSDIGNYPISVSATTNSDITYTKVSKLNAVSPVNNLGQIFIDKRNNIKNIKNIIDSMDNFSASKIEQYIKLDESEADLNQLESEYNSTTNETEILQIANELFALPIPDDMIIDSQSEKTISPNSANINLEYFSSAIGKEINSSDEENYKKAIINWNNQNIQIKVSANRFDFSVNGNVEEGFSIYKLNIENSGQDSSYLIIANLNYFDSDKTFSQGTNSNYLPLSEKNINIEIASSDNLDIKELPLFVAPDISKLDLTNSGTTGKTPLNLKNLLIYLGIGIGVLLIAIVFYFIYNKFIHRKKKTQEERLFKDKNELYNLTNYIKNARKNGMADSEIVNNLKKLNWSDKKIKYAMDEIARQNK